MNLKNFQLPKAIEREEDSFTDLFGKFFIQPMERGFGITVGNSLRRVLLSSIEGAAFTSIKIDGVVHEYGTVPGMVEDVTELILALKLVRIKYHGFNWEQKRYIFQYRNKINKRASYVTS